VSCRLLTAFIKLASTALHLSHLTTSQRYTVSHPVKHCDIVPVASYLPAKGTRFRALLNIVTLYPWHHIVSHRTTCQRYTVSHPVKHCDIVPVASYLPAKGTQFLALLNIVTLYPWHCIISHCTACQRYTVSHPVKHCDIVPVASYDIVLPAKGTLFHTLLNIVTLYPWRHMGS